eukprot:CAMPEP_0119342098 /NCGR_PEP_ID=MMETSP1333-20130426/104003_1 /TAXON_ID=418940 /ORGANISM="Scyphosphaera apsteinii, Strain RCC1455" /LENGTH=39 /DNA_ID= /DNA_START= /DNA_END= /DNA_ORIENTATION=
MKRGPTGIARSADARRVDDSSSLKERLNHCSMSCCSGQE